MQEPTTTPAAYLARLRLLLVAFTHDANCVRCGNPLSLHLIGPGDNGIPSTVCLRDRAGQVTDVGRWYRALPPDGRS